MRADKMTEEADWKDGINAFRSLMWKEITHLQEEINKLKQKIGELQ
tara:strand:- start:348 stop:485 length:138 start_codon:yes stop_codon:yes gene_type:complete